MSQHKIHFITGNKNKLIEVEAILGGVVSLTNQSLDLVEIQGTIEEISRDKAIRAANEVRIETPGFGIPVMLTCSIQIKGPVLVEDTSLCFNALKELPGPYM